MRGLTQLEAAILRGDVAGAEFYDDDPRDARVIAATDSLVARGCLVSAVVHQDENYDHVRHSITDLGYLALRVAAAAEAWT